MTYVELINAVLRRLRETSISNNWSGTLPSAANVSDYQKLIGDLVNEAKREVEDAWNWNNLRTTTTLTTSAGTQEYVLTGSNNRSRILMAQETSTGNIIREMNDKVLQYRKYPTSAVPQNIPEYYSVTAEDSVTGSLKVSFDPVPDGTYDVVFRMVNPQDEFDLPLEYLKVPSQPVILGAWARAISERGEDGGSMSDMVFGQYQTALGDAIAIDAGRQQDEVTWYVG